MIKNGASDARAAMKSIPTREGLKPSNKIVKILYKQKLENLIQKIIQY